MLQFFYKMKKNKKGFTLIELIVVIAILAILALLAIPRLSGFTESARQADDKEKVAIAANAGAMYLATNPTETTVTEQKLIDTKLVNDGDLDMVSQAYTGKTITFTVTAGRECVASIAPNTGYIGYTITK